MPDSLKKKEKHQYSYVYLSKNPLQVHKNVKILAVHQKFLKNTSSFSPIACLFSKVPIWAVCCITSPPPPPFHVMKPLWSKFSFDVRQTNFIFAAYYDQSSSVDVIWSNFVSHHKLRYTSLTFIKELSSEKRC